jgi:ABC-2 family transporter protein
VTRTVVFAREQLRAPFTLALLIAVPALFVASAAGALSDFADALGGSLAGDAAVALSAGWAAAFISGTLGFFQAASSRGADRRLALAGLGPARVATARIAASVLLAAVAAAAAFAALVLRSDLDHPLHAAVAVLAFALLYLAVGILIGSVVSSPLEGSLLVVFVFLLDAFAGPGMTGGSAPPWAISQKAADVLIAAGAGAGSPAAEWVEVALVTGGALVAAFLVFVASARSRA